MSYLRVGDGNKVKKLQKDAIRAKRNYFGQSNDNEAVMKELDGLGTDSESPIRFSDKKDEAIEAGAKAIIKTEDIINNAKPNGTAFKKHTKRKNVLEKEMENIKKS